MSFIVALFFVVVGGTLIYISLFLYEPEEQALDSIIQNALDDWWCRLDDYKVLAISRHTLFMQRVARLASLGFDSLFGPRLFSIRALTVAGCSATFAAGFCEVIVGVTLLLIEFSQEMLSDVVQAFAYTNAILFLNLLAIRKPQFIRIIAPVAFVVALSPFVMLSFAGNDKSLNFTVQVTIVYAVGLVIGVFSLVAFIALLRWTLHRSSCMDSVVNIIGLGFVNILVAISFVVVPLVFASAMMVVAGGSAFDRPELSIVEMFAGILAMIGAMNLTVFFPALALALLSASLILHRLFWPSVSRPVYALARAGIVKRRKTTFAIGIALLTSALPLFGKWIKLSLSSLM
ncbi:hypothetical protein [Roseimaritima ulvae]|uniref:Uncharacterized protein n=1 Tax=Roseimaritima ulvae TaxID=980254 RepID=A0A5B9QRB3_9BACT|nr:hypothetical protein [Roseimaritima ulvae]QEG40449.1 hypothetical protein UC8_24610 [Roseimaritima ulvae]